MTWDDRTVGAYGQGIAEQVLPIQAEICRGILTVQETHHRFIKPAIWIEEGSEVSGVVNNEVGTQYVFRGQRPIFDTPTGLNPETYQWIETNWRRVFDVAGLQLSSATGARTPPGIDAAVAIREYRMIETERFAMQASRFDQFYTACAKTFVAMARDLYRDADSNVVVLAPGTKAIRKISWADVDLYEDHCYVQVWPTNAMPTEPHGKRQFAVELFRDGFANRTQALSLMDIPDDRLFLDRELAALEEAEFLVEEMLDKPDFYESPDEFMDPEACIYVAKGELVRARRNRDDDVSPQSIRNLKRFIRECAELIKPPDQPPPPPPQAPKVVDPASAPIQGLSAAAPTAS